MRTINTHRPPSKSSIEDRAREGRVFEPMSMSSSTSGAGIEEAHALRSVLGAPSRDLELVHLIFEIVNVLSEHARIGCCVAPTASEQAWQVLAPSCETIHTMFSQESRFGRRPERESYNHGMLAKVARSR